MTMTEEPRAVMAMEIADRMLAEVASVDEVRQVINFAEQARLYARQSKLGTSAVNHATVIKIRAEQKLADIVDEGQERGVIADVGTNQHEGARDASTLPSLGIESARLAEARLLRDRYTPDELAQRQAEANERDEVLSRQQLIAEARREKDARAENQRNAEIQSARVKLLFPIYDALSSLSSVEMPASEWAKRVPAYSAQEPGRSPE